jgi:hypothetical protein
MHYFHARVVLVQFPNNARRVKLRQTCIFASGGIFGSHSAFHCVRGAKRRCTIFHARVGPVLFLEKAHHDMLHRTCILHPVGSTGHVVYSGVSGVQNIDALFFRL